MIPAIKFLFGSPKPWQEEIQELHKTLVPPQGEAETLQGELVRSIQNLADECYRNGWMNWDEANEDEIEILRRHLIDPSVFTGSDQSLIAAKLNEIEYCGSKGAGEGRLGYEEIKFVAERVVVWCRKNRNPILKTPDETWLEYGT